jgi:hypothetical protein
MRRADDKTEHNVPLLADEAAGEDVGPDLVEYVWGGAYKEPVVVVADGAPVQA